MKTIIACGVAAAALLLTAVAVAQPVIPPDIPADHRMRNGSPYYLELARCSGMQMAYAISRTGNDARVAAEVAKQYNRSAFKRVVTDRKLNANDAKVLESVSALLAPISEKARKEWLPILAANGGEQAFNAATAACVQVLHTSDFEM